MEANQSPSQSNKRVGVPPSHPLTSPRQQPQSSGVQNPSSNSNRGLSHSRSLSQSALISLDCLPPLSPSPVSSQLNSPVMSDLLMEEKSGSVSNGGGLLRVNESLPPRRGHRRSMSDSVPLGFSAMIQSSPQLIPIGSQGGFDRAVFGMGDRKCEGEVVNDLLNAYVNLENVDTFNSSVSEDKCIDSRVSGSKTSGNGSDNEVESRVNGKLNGLKRTASEDIAPTSRHHRSFSMDSILGNLSLDDENAKPFASANQVGQHLPSNSMDGKLTRFNLEFGNGEFSELELKKIMANEKLMEIAMADPKRVKRILANRLSAARSKERKMRYISELELKVQTLQTEATTLSAQVTVLQRDSSALMSQNSGLTFRLQALEQQAQLKDALNEALVAEVQRLRLAASEVNGDFNQIMQIDHQHPDQLGSYHQLQQHHKQLQ